MSQRAFVALCFLYFAAFAAPPSAQEPPAPTAEPRTNPSSSDDHEPLVTDARAQSDATPAEAPAVEPPSLEVISRFRFKPESESSTVMDIRWAGNDSIHVLRAFHGVNEHELREGLPTRRWVLPGRHQQRKMPGCVALGVSGDLAVVGGRSSGFAWRDLSIAEPADFAVHMRGASGGLGGMDVHGETVAVLGVPNVKAEQDDPFATLWTGDLGKNLEQFKAFHRFKEAESTQELSLMFMHYYAGGAGIRYLPNGDLFVFPGYPQAAYLFSPGGRIKTQWVLPELVATKEQSDLLLKRRALDASWRADVEEWAGDRYVVDEVFAIGKTPALVVHRTKKGKSLWHVIVLDSDEGTWYRIPMSESGTQLRLQADTNRKGEIVFVAAHRVDPQSPSLAGEEVLVARFP